jgi:hypothetical protein
MRHLHPSQILALYAVKIEILGHCRGLSINPVDPSDIERYLVANLEWLDATAKGLYCIQADGTAAVARLQSSA